MRKLSLMDLAPPLPSLTPFQYDRGTYIARDTDTIPVIRPRGPCQPQRLLMTMRQDPESLRSRQKWRKTTPW